MTGNIADEWAANLTKVRLLTTCRDSSAFGKEGALRGRKFGDQIHTFSCLSVLHNAVVAWNTLHIGPIVGQLRAEGQVMDDDILGLTTPLFRKHLNPFGKYHFDLERMRQTEGDPEQGIA